MFQTVNVLHWVDKGIGLRVSFAKPNLRHKNIII